MTGAAFVAAPVSFVKFRERPMQPGSPESLSVSGA